MRESIDLKKRVKEIAKLENERDATLVRIQTLQKQETWVKINNSLQRHPIRKTKHGQETKNTIP